MIRRLKRWWYNWKECPLCHQDYDPKEGTLSYMISYSEGYTVCMGCKPRVDERIKLWRTWVPVRTVNI
jgi:hypothetical protein